MLLLIVLIILFGGGFGYIGHTQWGPQGGFGVGLGTILDAIQSASKAVVAKAAAISTVAPVPAA